MAPGKRSSLPGSTAGSSRQPKKQKSTSSSSMSTEDTTGYSMQDRESKDMIQNQICKVEEEHAAAVQKLEQLQIELNKLKEMLKIRQNPPDTNQTRSEPDHGRYELKIIGTIKNRVFTNSLVKGQNGEFLKVEILHNGEKITSGAFASAKFEVLVVEGDFCVSKQGWSSKTFQESLVEAQGEGGSILKGRYVSELKNGEALLDGLTFKKNNSSWNKKRWRLGITLLESNGVRVLEAISDCIRVLDRHGKACEKPHPPSLKHGVECLEKVGKKRALDLKRNKIHTIKDFLQLLNRKRFLLLKILGIKSKSDASLEKMVEHAKECYVGSKLYSYRKNNCLLFFNSVYGVVGAQFGCRYRSFDKLQCSKQVLVNKWKKGFYKSIKKGNLTADFKMVNKQPLPIEHDDIGIPTDNDAQQNEFPDETLSQVREGESSVAPNSTMEVDERHHDPSLPGELEGSNTSPNIPQHSMLPSPGYGVDVPLQGTIVAEQQSQEDIVHNQNNLVNRRLILKKMSIAVKFVIYLRRDHLFNYMSMLDLDQMGNWNMDDFLN